MTLPPPPPGGDRRPTPPPPPPGVGPSAVGVPAVPHPAKDGKLIAAGVLGIIPGVVLGAFGVFAVVAAILFEGSDDDFFFGSGDGWAVLFGLIAAFLLVGAALCLIGGIGCVTGRGWGRIMTLIVWGLGLALMLIGFINEPAGESIVPLAWSAAVVALAAVGTPWK